MHTCKLAHAWELYEQLLLRCSPWIPKGFMNRTIFQNDGFFCNFLCFILHIFKHYSERSIPRLHQIAKGSMVHKHTHKEVQESGKRACLWR